MEKLTQTDRSKLISNSNLDGWLLGYVGNPWMGPWPKKGGDLFVVAPDDTKANIAWESKGPPIKLLMGPDNQRWGVFQVRFPIEVMCEGDLVINFHQILPLLKAEYWQANGGKS